MSVKKFTAMICAFVMALSICPRISEAKAQPQQTNDPNTAEIIFDSEKPTATGFKVVEPGTDKTPLVAIRDGESCWLMDKLQGNEKSTINFSLSNNMKAESFDGSEYDIEIDYFDSGKGYCFLYYNNIDGELEWQNQIYTNATGIWKTQKFTLTNADFSETYNGKYDFSLSIKATSTSSGTSSESIAIKRVKVTRRPNQNKLYVSTKIDESGNTFEWFKEDKIINATVHNYSGADAEAEISFKAVDESGLVKGEKTEKVSIPKGGTNELKLNFGDVEYCDIYKLIADVKMSDGTSFSQMPTKFAIIKTDPDGIKNDDIMFAAHPDWRGSDVIPDFIEVMAKSNVSGMRENINDRMADEVVPILAKNNLKYLPIFAGIPDDSKIDPTASNSQFEMPYTEKGFEGWRRNVIKWTEKIKDVCDRYEIWNEPNIEQFNKYLPLCQGEQYTELCRIAREEIDKIDPGAILGGPSITSILISSDWGTAGKPYFDDCMKNGMWKYLDACAVHAYAKIDEADEVIESMKYYRNEFAKAGKPDAELWNTEVGFTTANKETPAGERVGAYNSRVALQYKAEKAASMAVFYNFEQKGTVKTDREDMFGHVSPPFNNCKLWGTMFFPEDSFLMVAGFNYIMAQSTADKIIDTGDENIKFYTYDSQKFGKKIGALFSQDDKNRTVSLKLGKDKVDVYDSKGNKTEIYGRNGTVTLNIGQNPIYIVDDLSTFEIVEDKTIEIGDTDLDIPENDIFELNIKKNIDKNLTIETEMPESAELIESNGFEDGNAVIKIKNNAPENEKYRINVNIKDGETIIYSAIYSITSTKAVSTSMSVTIDDKDYNLFNGKLKIKNHSTTEAIKGHIEFKESDITKYLRDVDIGIIPAGSTGEVEFSLGKIEKKGQKSLQYTLVLDNKKAYTTVGNFDISIAKYADKKPVIDGNLDGDEWYFDTAMYADKPDQIRQIKNWEGTNDVSGKAMVMWDEENMYFGAEVTDNKFTPAPSEGLQYMGDGIQFGVFYGEEGFIAIGQASTTFHEIGLALTENGVQAYRWVSQDNALPGGLVEDLDLAVVNKGTKTYYEAKIPWTTLLKPGQKPSAGQEMAFSYLINDNDGEGRRGWIEYTSGIGETKNTELFTHLKLLK